MNAGSQGNNGGSPDRGSQGQVVFASVHGHAQAHVVTEPRRLIARPAQPS
jgi:hypothetical protein